MGRAFRLMEEEQDVYKCSSEFRQSLIIGFDDSGWGV